MLGDKQENDPQFCTSLWSRIPIHSFSQLHAEHLATEIWTGKAKTIILLRLATSINKHILSSSLLRSYQ